MERTACVDIRALPLQLLLRAHPDWAGGPVVVVDRDKPQGVILYANRAAQEHRIFPGLRFAAGLSLCGTLHGGAVATAEIEAAVAQIAERLWDFSPEIEPAQSEPGVFWLNAGGMQHLYPTLDAWAARVEEALRGLGLRAVVAVGHTRFGSYVAAKAHPRAIVFPTPAAEQAFVEAAPVTSLALAPATRDLFLKLGIQRIGQFMRLPVGSIRKRFGVQADALHRQARGTLWTPLEPAPLREPLEAHTELDYPETNTERLLFTLAPLVRTLLTELEARHENLAGLWLRFRLDDGNTCTEELAPAKPTRDAPQLFGLLRLRLEALSLSAGVVEITTGAAGVRIAHEQLDLLHDAPRQNLEAAERAVAALRAEFGNGAVVCARLQAGHLPEARYGWETLGSLALPAPGPGSTRTLVRRVYPRPIPLATRQRREPDGWMVAGMAEGPVEEVLGPYLITGGWWVREVLRAYYYVRTRSGRWLWIYHDRRRRLWFLQGEVE